MTPEKKYFEFVEENGYEGETWSRFFPVEGNEEFLKWFEPFAFNQPEDSETIFYISKEFYTPEEVSFLLKRKSRAYYAQEFGKHDVVIDLEKIENTVREKIEGECFGEKEAVADIFYKLGIRDYFK